MFKFEDKEINLSGDIILKNVLTNNNIYNHKVYKYGVEIGTLIYENKGKELEINMLNAINEETKYEILNALFKSCEDDVSVFIKLRNIKAVEFFLN